IPLSSGAQPTPSMAISRGRRPAMARPASSMRPARGRRKPMIVRSVVVLPAPLRPTGHTTSARPTSSDTARRMWLAWLVTSIASMVSTSACRRAAADHRVDDLGVGLDLARARVGQHAPLVQRDDPVGVAEHDVHVVLDLDHGLDADAP